MILNFFRSRNKKIAAETYVKLVDHARSVAFYARDGVPDTIDGRFDMILLHIWLIHDRLRNEQEQTHGFAQLVFEQFVKDMDASLRELGVGDVSVPKKMKKVGEALYGRLTAYDAAARGEEAFEDVVIRNIFRGDVADRDAPARIVSYIERARMELGALSDPDIYAGTIRFPDAEALA